MQQGLQKASGITNIFDEWQRLNLRSSLEKLVEKLEYLTCIFLNIK